MVRSTTSFKFLHSLLSALVAAVLLLSLPTPGRSASDELNTSGLWLPRAVLCDAEATCVPMASDVEDLAGCKNKTDQLEELLRRPDMKRFIGFDPTVVEIWCENIQSRVKMHYKKVTLTQT
jgi:hypothetical protein